ncbi:hypothetical protein BDV28DRAFT_154896 [Aspergillus coremiiformis]|uniref:Glycosyltransferase family 31 protein n=1 Tax=Aspergillus coremiiformis TaxID=138285 RepID=A0A5N6ZJ31_9EURO|nr:hypothetical protein BDV28DRAFT_154896 [Aspergillus coremiiformis]
MRSPLGIALSRIVPILLASTSIALCLASLLRRTSLQPTWSANHRMSNDCHPDVRRLQQLGFDALDYAQLQIAVMRTEDFAGFRDELHAPFPTYHTVHLEHLDGWNDTICAPVVTLTAPRRSSPPDASHILFGVATTLKRLDESLGPFAHWAGGTGARIIAVIDPDPRKSHVLQRAHRLGIHLTIVESSTEYLDRYFSLISVLHHNREVQTRWAVLIDDDTFFPSMQNLVNKLATYNATEPQYIGALTEDFEQMHDWGYMAYGGAGVFLSMPLLEQLNGVYAECSRFQDTGDRRIARCIYAHTTTKLSWERGLYQLDLHGDVSGFFESGRPLPLSVHHWKSWFQVDMEAMSAIASICSDHCQLRRWRMSDGWFLVNGFSLIQYSTPSEDLQRMEQTWESGHYPDDQFTHSLGPLRPKDEMKISLRLKHVVKGKEVVRQIYARESTSENPQVVEIIWYLAE